jgi:cytochrome c553
VLVCGSVSAADAKANWSQHCAKCHAEDGSGNTPSGRKLGIRDYRDPKVQAELKERDMIKATRGGYRAKQREVMKPYGGVLSDEEIRDLVAHIRTMKKS